MYNEPYPDVSENFVPAPFPTGPQRDYGQPNPRGGGDVTHPPPSNGPGGGADPNDAIRDAYRKYLGREPSMADLAAHTTGGRFTSPTNIATAVYTIQNSPEAKAYAASHGAAAGPRNAAGQITAAPGATPNANFTNPTASQGADTSRYAPRLIQQNGQWVLQEHGNARVLTTQQEIADAQAYVTSFWTQFPTGFQPGVGVQENKGYERGGVWSNNAGDHPFQYTRQSYGGGIGNYTGFEPSNIGTSNSIKYIFLDSTSGLKPTDPGALAEVVRRLNAQGIPAKVVSEDSIDFGQGEGPVDVVDNGKNLWAWMSADTSGGAEGGGGGGTPPPSMSALVTPPPAPTPPPATTLPPTPAPIAPPEEPPGPSPNPPGPDVQGDPVNDYADQLESTGVQILERRGDQMRILTAEDKAKGNQYGTWITVERPRSDKNESMADLAA